MEKNKFTSLVAHLSGIAFKCVNTPEWPMLYMSRYTKKLTGYAVKEFQPLGFKMWGDLIHPEDRQMVWDRIQKANQEHRPFQIEYRIRTKGGYTKWVMQEGRAGIPGNAGEIILEGLISDITQKKSTESYLDYFSSVLKIIREINQLFGKEKNIKKLIRSVCTILVEMKRINGAWIVLTGAADQCGAFLESASASVDTKKFKRFINIFESGKLPICCKKVLGAEQIICTSYLTKECGSCPLFDTYNESTSFVAGLRYGTKQYGFFSVSLPKKYAPSEHEKALFTEIAGDVSFALFNLEVDEKRTQEEEKLLEESFCFRTLIDQLPDPIYYKDTKNRFVRVNRAKAEKNETSPEAMIGKTDFDYFPPEIAQLRFADDTKVFQNGTTVLSEQVESLVDGKDHQYSVTKLLVKNRYGKPIGTLGISRDVSNQKQVEQELQTALKQSETREKILAALLESAEAVLDCETFEEGAEKIFQSCKNAIGAQSGYVALLNKAGTENEVVYLDDGGLPCMVDPELPMPVRGLRAESYHLKKPVIDNNFGNSKWMRYIPEGHVLLQNVMFVPIMYENSAVGILGLANKQGGFDQKDADIANAFSVQSAIALRRLHDREAVIGSEKKYRNLFDNIPIGLYVTDSMEKVINMNRELIKMLGLEKQETCEVVDINDFCVNPQDRIEWQSRLAKYGLVQHLETKWKHIDGSEIWVSENAHLIEGDDGQQYCEVSVENITKRKQLEETLYEMISRLETAKQELNRRAGWMEALNSLSREIASRNDFDSVLRIVMNHIAKNFEYNFAGIGLLNEDDSFLVRFIDSKNPNIIERLGIQKNSILSKEELNTSFFIRNNSALFEADLTSVPSALEENGSADFFQRLQSEGLFSLVVVPMSADFEQIGHFFMVFDTAVRLTKYEIEFLTGLIEYVSISFQNFKLYEDLGISYSQLKKAQETMRKQERLQAIGQIASGITHDINNTLSPITLYTEALLETEPGLSSRAKKYLGTIKNAVSDIENVTHRLRSFYRQDESGGKEPVFLGKLFDEVMDLTRPRWETIPNKQGCVIQFDKQIDESMPPLIGLKSEIRESLINIIFNAVDAMPMDGKISLSGRIDEQNVIITIQDTGEGMNEEQQGRCLEPFYTTKGSKGTGLGLPSVYGMVQRHGGNMKIESTPKNGTTIELYFPKSEYKDGKSLPQETLVSVIPLQILCVDDDQRILDVLKEMLTIDGHTVDICTSGNDAIALFRDRMDGETGFNLVITDLGMPGMDGHEVARRIKEIDPTVPVVLLSGWGNVKMQSDGLPQYIDCMLGKPPKMDVLRKAIRKTYGRNG